MKFLSLIFYVAIFCSCNDKSTNNVVQKKIATIDTTKWTPEQEIPVLFVQIQSKAFKSELVALIVRQKTEQTIDERLQAANIGKWFAGDIGPSGANMLFEVKNVDDGMKIIMEVLKEKKLESTTVIGHRIYISSDDWDYKIIYPENYKGEFNTM